ncbi:HEXXH motif domain-containing protein [Streptomyces sp. Ru71]|uniref:aKG-HExxH-type peptide beta-hydroxylase n=1 Tax=Streptomyces sp. Ru71 TaxID=2080746 RepID=UPI000CDD81B2|nr:HEXXH motif-containing putative peptide modification protein [Streptomyces sp. Ru71]POX48910.1 HEXXH motif domain-containing protein [Streptomyces sp. Ru71]
MRPSPHRMPGALFDAVAAGGGGAEALRLLARAEHSRRLACAWAVTDAANRTGGRVAQEATRAWELLTSAARTAPDAAAAVLTHPTAGPALFEVLARLTHPRPGEEPPMGRFTALAAAAAVRAGLPGRAALPMDGAWVALPSLGRARFPGAGDGDRAEVRTGPGGAARIVVRTADGAEDGVPVPPAPYRSRGRWHGAHLLTTLEGGARLLLDVVDRPSFPHAADRPDGIGPQEAGAWAAVAREACALLRADHPEVYEELAAGERLLVPLTRPGPGIVSGSSAETFGCLALSLPRTAAGFAVTVAHEMQHNKFAALLHLFDLFHPGGPERFYAPWRPDPRPLLGLFHGAYAHLGVARFWNRRRECEADPQGRFEAHVQFARWRLAAREATLVLLASDRLTPLGHRFAGRMLATLDALCHLPVPAAAVHRAESAARAHRDAWRDRHGDTDGERMLSA